MPLPSSSPRSILLIGVFLVACSILFPSIAEIPSDDTPLTDASGTVLDTSTTVVEHHNYWTTSIVTLSLDNGQAIHFSGESNSPLVEAFERLRRGDAIQARVDADRDIWEASANDQPLLTRDDKLADLHMLRRNRAMFMTLLMAIGLGAGISGFRQMQAADRQPS